MKKGYLYFHQGWSDIMCQLSLVNYYNLIYDELIVVMRHDSDKLFNFYIRDLTGIYPKYIMTDNGRHINNDHFNVSSEYDLLFHGHHDAHRNSIYSNSFVYNCNHNGLYFIEGFYRSYNIDYNVRIEQFNLNRDIYQENVIYNNFINTHGKSYIIYHDDPMNHIHGPNSVSTKINFPIIYQGIPYINLNKCSYTFFDYIEVIRNAMEIHLTDSVWAAMCYHIDAKYGIFSDKTINLYAKRGHVKMFTSPKLLSNWNIII